MSEMTNLFKAQDVYYRTEVFENFNEIEQKIVDNDDIFANLDPAPYRVQGVFKLKFKSQDETVFLENYGNPFAEVHMKRKTLVIEENENKIALKFYSYINYRDVSKKYFKVRRQISYLTFNIKRKTFYSGELNLKRKNKIGSKMSMHKTDLRNMSLYNSISYFYMTSKDDENIKLKDEVMSMFLNRVAERTNTKFDDENLLNIDKYYQLYLKFSGIKYPDAFSKFKSFYTPKKEIRENGNNLVTWFMNKHKLKGTKIRELLNKYNNIDLNGIITFYRLFGQDLFNKINSESFLSLNYNDYYGDYYPTFENVSKKEKENIVKILNTSYSETVLNSLNDHLQYKESLKKYGEFVKITATNYEDYVKEHSEWSTLVQSYRSGTVTRFYGDDAYLIEKPIYNNGETYYPVLLKTTEQYEGESMVQSNCVRTYSEKPYCFIVSLRKGSEDSVIRASIELKYINDGVKVVQKLGKYNKHLSEDWLSPINELEGFANYLYSKGMIKLPEMTKRFPNGKVIKQTAVFENKPDIKYMLPTWDNHEPKNYLLDYIADYDLFDELP
jgi:hypothetical protein